MTTKKLAEIEKLLSGIIPFKTLGIPNDNFRSGLVGRTSINLCEHKHTCVRPSDQCYVQVVCGEMVAVYTSCKIEDRKKSHHFFQQRAEDSGVDRGEEMNDNRGVLIFKNEFPYRAVDSIEQASKTTFVPVNTIYNMIVLQPKTKKEKKNGGRTTPDGWGFDYLA